MFSEITLDNERKSVMLCLKTVVMLSMLSLHLYDGSLEWLGELQIETLWDIML